MTKTEKNEVIDLLKSKFSQYENFYITNTESLTVEQVNKLRKTCFDNEVQMQVAKNTLIKKALESLDSEKYGGVYDALHQVTALMFSNNPKEPAVIISSFRKSGNTDKPILKAAYINGEIYVGDNQLSTLTKIKTKNELIGDVISSLQSPIQKVVGALQNKPEDGTAAASTTEATSTDSTTSADTAAPATDSTEAAPATAAE